MIDLYTGKPGSGKSLHCAMRIDKAVRRHRNIILNFPINHDYWSNRVIKKSGEIIEVSNEELIVPFLLDYANTHHKRNKKGQIKEHQTLLVIDECQTMFNARTWNRKDRMPWNIFFTQHRKYGYDIVLVTQSIAFIDRQIRELIQYESNHRNLCSFKIIGKVIYLLLGGRNLHLMKVVWMDTKEDDHLEFFIGKKKYFKLYDSYKIFDETLLKMQEQVER